MTIHRPAAAPDDLPFRLGVVPSPGGTWDDFVRLAPNRDLPAFAAEWTDATPRPVAPERVALFSQAHRAAAAYFTVADRLADGQVPADADLLATRDRLRASWIDAFAEATGDRHAAEARAARDLSLWAAGVRRERVAAAAGAMTTAEYVAMTHLKLRVVSTVAGALVDASGDARRALHLRAVYDVFLFALQCRDDAVDEAEDRRTRGASTADLLGLSAPALLCAAPPIVAWAAARAREASFTRLAAWMDDFAVAAAAPASPRDAFEAAFLVDACCGSVLQ